MKQNFFCQIAIVEKIELNFPYCGENTKTVGYMEIGVRRWQFRMDCVPCFDNCAKAGCNHM